MSDFLKIMSFAVLFIVAAGFIITGSFSFIPKARDVWPASGVARWLDCFKENK